MPNTVYVLYSHQIDKFYKGQTSNLVQRIDYHKAGYESFTSIAKDWVCIWSTDKPNRTEALLLEKKLKNLNRSRLISFLKKYSVGLTESGKLILKRFE